jgi:glycosyltransferase involved in cell wall biosynthesis
LRILHVSPSYYPAFQFGGPIQSVQLLNKTLRAQGVQVEVFTTNAGLESRADIPLYEWQDVEGVPVKYFPYRGYVHYNFSVPLWKELHKRVREYDLVHITAVWNFPVLAASRACRRFNVPYIISPRGTIYPETIALKSSFFKKSYYRLFARQYLNEASAVHFTAADEQEKVNSYLGLTSQALVIPNGVDLEAFTAADQTALDAALPAELADKPYLLFLGRLHPKKGLDLLVKAFRRISEKHSNLLLVLAGPDDDGYGKTVRQWIADYQLEHKVVFTGMVTGLAKQAVIKNARLFVLPSYSENFGMSVVEAMANEVAVVVSNAVGISPAIREWEGGVVTDTSPDSVAEGVLSLLDDNKRRVQVARNGRGMIDSLYKIEAVAAAFRRAYEMNCKKERIGM